MAFDAQGGNNRYLPTPIIFDILLHLSVKKILICRCVCKAWHSIISHPEFTKQYFAGAARADTYPLLRPVGSSWLSRTLYFVDPKNYICDNTAKLGLETKFKIPLHNFEKVLKSESSAELTQESDGRKRKRCLKLNRSDHFFEMMNTCNGFLCLSRWNVVVVCNPVTGVFVNVPVPTVAGNEAHLVRYGLGFCSRTNTYKVIRMFGCTNGRCWIETGYQCPYSSSAQIQTLGSKSWKNIGLAPMSTSLHHPTTLNGTLNWLYDDMSGPQYIVSFDFDSSRFRPFSLPSGTPAGANRATFHMRVNTRIGVLRDQLCFTSTSKYHGCLDIWVMSKYGDQGSWTKVCNVSFSGDQGIGLCGYYQPITRLENGAIILFHCKHYRKFGLIYYEHETQKLKYFKVQGITARFEAVGFTPTFVSLRNVILGDEVEVLNINSRCAKLKIQSDSSPLFLMQEHIA